MNGLMLNDNLSSGRKEYEKRYGMVGKKMVH